MALNFDGGFSQSWLVEMSKGHPPIKQGSLYFPFKHHPRKLTPGTKRQKVKV